MVNRMVFFYVYDIEERFTSDFGESLLPVLFSPTEPINRPIYMTSFKILKLNQRISASSPLLKRLSATSEHLRLLE